MDQRTRLLEAALFAAPRPLALDELALLDADATEDDWRRALAELKEHYANEGHGVELVEVAHGWQVTTLPMFAEAIERAAFAARPARLSAAALEVLAIVAYRQPVGRAEIEEIRGVSCGGVLRMLQERGLLDVAGRSEGLGRPLLYATTPQFLELMGLADLADLPRTEELAVAMRPPSAEGERREGASPEEAEPEAAGRAERSRRAAGAGPAADPEPAADAKPAAADEPEP